MFDVGKTSDCEKDVDCGSCKYLIHYIYIFKNNINNKYFYNKKEFSSLFFLTYIMITSIVMLNLFILIILNDFEEYNLKDDNPVELFKENLENFRISWGIFSYDYKGKKIKERNLVPFFMSLNPPLGTIYIYNGGNGIMLHKLIQNLYILIIGFGENADKKEVAKCVMKMDLHG